MKKLISIPLLMFILLVGCSKPEDFIQVINNYSDDHSTSISISTSHETVKGAKGEAGKDGVDGKRGLKGDKGDKWDRCEPAEYGLESKIVENNQTRNNSSTNYIHLEFKNGDGGISFSDPTLLFRLMVFPLFVWVATSILKYGLTRFHLVRTLYVDIDHQARLSLVTLKRFRDWLKEIDKNEKILESSFLWEENTQIFNSLQNDIRACLWGNEIAAVHLFYRDYDQFRANLNKANEKSEEIRALYREQEELPTLSKLRDHPIKRALIKSIGDHLQEMEMIANFWVKLSDNNDVLNRNEKIINHFVENRSLESIAHKMFWHIFCWQIFFVGLPLALALWTVINIVSWVPIELQLTNLWLGLIGATFLSAISLVVMKYFVDSRIEKNILHPLNENFRKRILRKKTGFLTQSFEKIFSSVMKFLRGL